MKLTTTPTKKGRINVFADGEYQFTVPLFNWHVSGLTEGCEADPAALEALRREGEAADAREKAAALLAVRAHGERELYRKLTRRFSPEAAAAAVETSRENLLLDDEAYAGALAAEWHRNKGWAPARIEAALRERGLDREIAKNAVAALDIDRKTGIISIIRKMRLPEEITRKEYARLIRRLQAAGYSMAEIRAVVRTEDGEYEADGAED